MFRTVVHLSLHFMVPAIVARWMFADRWKFAWLVMMLTMAVDLDHLLADPVFDPNRCGIGFHPLHSLPALALYPVLAIFPRTRLIGLGVVIHMLLDGSDCIWMGMLS